MFQQDQVQDTRQVFYSSWEKYRHNLLLSPLEKQIVDVILAHPEYHRKLECSSADKGQAYFPEMGETNPFLHMGLHLALRDQIATDRPSGINAIYQQLTQKHADSLMAEHLIMELLAESLWQAQRQQTLPDEVSYLAACRQLL